MAEENKSRRFTLGILAVDDADHVPGTVAIMSHEQAGATGEKANDEVEAGIFPASQEFDESSLKRTSDGTLVLNPQPEDTPNDPLNWPIWRRNAALLSLGFYCMLGGGMTPILAAGFNDVAATYQVSYSQVALTTGLYMMGLGVGSVVFAPTAQLFGKRAVYLLSPILFGVSAVWCALAPSYGNLVAARVFQGIAVSPVECLPSTTITEIFFLHERAYRVGIYTLLLLGGKNLIPLFSAGIIQASGWRWVFWAVAIMVAFCGLLLFLFVPETFWDRQTSPPPHRLSRPDQSQPTLSSRLISSLRPGISRAHSAPAPPPPSTINWHGLVSTPFTHRPRTPGTTDDGVTRVRLEYGHLRPQTSYHSSSHSTINDIPEKEQESAATEVRQGDDAEDDFGTGHGLTSAPASLGQVVVLPDGTEPDEKMIPYTSGRRNSPPLSYLQTLKPWNGRISQANWLKVCIRPFILFAYPSVLWSTMVYALSVGWLIVLSQAVSRVYETRETYNFSPIQVGLVYISPFVGGVLGTAVAGQLSDVIVRFMARRNQGIYEPEFRLVMAIPITLCTGIGLMGFGWSAHEKDNFMVPTVFFGIISFGCCIGSTTAITFCVDSYREYATEALVTLNVSKNILHGLVWSLFFPQWLQGSGSKTVFLAIGGIQMACMLLTIPMYVYGKRARRWTVRQRMMERF